MPGRHKWSDLKASLTPEQQERMMAKTTEIRSTLPPTTYAQVQWAAEKYNRGEHRYNKYYRAVYEPYYPHTLMKPLYLSAAQAPDIEPLRLFLNQWKCHLTSASDRPVADAITELGSYREGLFDSAIEAKILDDSVFDATESAFDRLTSIQHVGPTIASKILGVLYPRFFVMWDTAIREAYFDRSNVGGHEFAIFMKEMRNSAISIVADTQNHGTKDPSGSISKKIGQDPPFTLAKFINDYIWLTVTKQERFSLTAAQERHA
jgi:hypothetical protein